MRNPIDRTYAYLTFVRSEPYHKYNLSAYINYNQLRLCCANDICEILYVFDEATTAKFETRFQSLGDSEKFLRKLKETYVRKDDEAKETLARILAYCDRKGMRYEKYTDVSFDGRE